jgi:hypothetical protein
MAQSTIGDVVCAKEIATNFATASAECKRLRNPGTNEASKEAAG